MSPMFDILLAIYRTIPFVSGIVALHTPLFPIIHLRGLIKSSPDHLLLFV